MSDPFRTAADHLRTLKPQFEQLASFSWVGEATYWLPAVRPKGFNGWEPVLHEADATTMISSNGVTLEPSQINVSPGQRPPPWAVELRYEGDTNTFWFMEPACITFGIHTDGRQRSPADCEALRKKGTFMFS
jgi:hypothetical protein